MPVVSITVNILKSYACAKECRIFYKRIIHGVRAVFCIVIYVHAICYNYRENMVR